MSVTINGTTGISPVSAAGTSASIDGMTVGRGAGAVATNTAVGASALAANTSGSVNTAVGQYALNGLTTGTQNTGVGYNAAGNVTSTGNYNSAFGASALTGITSGSNNTAIGVSALQTNTTASSNTAVGYQAGYSNTTGTYQTFVGYTAGHDTTGTNSTFVGQGAGYFVTTGAKNTILGQYNGNQGGLDIRTASNYIVLSDGDGNPRIVHNGGGVHFGGTNPYLTSYDSSLYAYGRLASTVGVFLVNNGTSWSSTSDERRKDIIEPIIDAVSKVTSLRAVIGKFKVDEEGTRRPFLIAQDVQAVFPEAVNTQEDEDGEFLGMSYTDMVPLLVAAIKELKAEFDAYKEAHP